jgi:hypothetical protein
MWSLQVAQRSASFPPAILQITIPLNSISARSLDPCPPSVTDDDFIILGDDVLNGVRPGTA